MMRPVRFLLFGVLVALNTGSEPIDAQTPPRGARNGDRYLRIDSPRDGAVVAAGDTLQVTVSSPNRTRFVAITIGMEEPIDTSDQEATSLPARFAIAIPNSTSPGIYNVTALAARADGQLFAATIEVDIERREVPRAVTSQVPRFYFARKGETTRFELLGDFGDHDFVDVTRSSRVTFESLDTAIATVDKSGTITAVASGHGAVVAWYGPRDSGIKVSIPVEVR